jgi:16S rRNA (cytidine1402-2'-O)-methyltransferase
MLYLVSTPIGNLEDITLRALRVLKEADFIACEDTRTSGILLKHYGIDRPLISFHSHSGVAKIDKILEALREGKNGALICDAGTPGISDPAYVLVQAVIEAGIPLSPIPGPSAVLSALVCSGAHTHDFRFLGFLPIKKGRKTLFESLTTKDYTVVIYESVHRIEKTVAEIGAYFGPEHPVVIARELTKKFEEFIRGTAAECLAELKTRPRKGEFVVIF